MRFNEILKSSSAVGNSNSTQAPWLALKCIVETCRIDFILKPFLLSFFTKKPHYNCYVSIQRLIQANLDLRNLNLSFFKLKNAMFDLRK